MVAAAVVLCTLTAYGSSSVVTTAQLTQPLTTATLKAVAAMAAGIHVGIVTVAMRAARVQVMGQCGAWVRAWAWAWVVCLAISIRLIRVVHGISSIVGASYGLCSHIHKAGTAPYGLHTPLSAAAAAAAAAAAMTTTMVGRGRYRRRRYRGGYHRCVCWLRLAIYS